MRETIRDSLRRQHPFFWVVVIAAVFGACACVAAWALIYKYYGLAKEGYQLDGAMRIIRVYPGGPAEGKLQVGDAILAVNGHPTGYNAFAQEFANALPGTAYTLEIERNTIKHSVEMKLVLHYSPDRSLNSELPPIILSFGFLFLAVLMGLLRPADPVIRHVFVAFFSLGLFFLWQGYTPSLYNQTEQKGLFFLVTLTGPLITLPILFHLFLRFPPGIPESKFGNVVKWGFYFVGSITQVTFLLSLLTGWQLHVYFPLVVPLFIASNFLAIVAVVIRNYRLITETRQRQQFKWIIFSSVIGFGTLFLAMTVEWLVFPQLKDISASAKSRIETVAYFLTAIAMLSIPMAWAYAILKHRVLDINVVIRRSLRYLLASRGFILIEALLAFALLSFVFAGRLGAWLDRFGSNTRTLITILGTVLMVLGLQSVNRKIRPLIDRRFFRDAYDAQQILTELGSSLRATTNVNQVLELTTAKIQQALYAANVTIFLRNGQHDFQSAVSSDYHEREKSSRTMKRDLHLPDEAFVVQRISDSSQPAEIDWDDPYSPVATQLAAMANGDAAAQQEFETLRELRTNLVLPLTAKEELLGVLALGPRAGDLPYSREDKRLLMNVAGQTALALENSRLIEQKIDLETENERRAHELEEARQLQLSMLPRKVPQLPHLDIAAFMKTATEVGGDYYDFHLSDDHTLTMAVGDATGHGLKAGTMVTATKSLFNETNGAESPAALLQRCSRALKRMNLRGLFMALTIARVQGNCLTIAAAGMPPLLVYRAATQQVEEILMKAMPLGSVSNYIYKEQEVTLSPGDVVVLMSDGLPERFNERGEMLDEQAIRTLLPTVVQLSSQAIIERLTALGDEWGGQRPQDDDVTFIVLKFHSPR